MQQMQSVGRAAVAAFLSTVWLVALSVCGAGALGVAGEATQAQRAASLSLDVVRRRHRLAGDTARHPFAALDSLHRLVRAFLLRESHHAPDTCLSAMPL